MKKLLKERVNRLLDFNSEQINKELTDRINDLFDDILKDSRDLKVKVKIEVVGLNEESTESITILKQFRINNISDKDLELQNFKLSNTIPKGLRK